MWVGDVPSSGRMPPATTMRDTDAAPPATDRALSGGEVLERVGEYPLYIDLFAGAGGVAHSIRHYPCARPACDVIGIDIDPGKAASYPGLFVAHDLREGLPAFVDALPRVDMVWASPPCRPFTGVQYAQGGANLIPLARDLLDEIDTEIAVIENVPRAREHLEAPVRFCGGAFDLGVRKHRVFETSFRAHGVACDHPDGGFPFCIGDREHPVEAYRAAHGFPRDAVIGTKPLRAAVPPAYVQALLDQYLRYAGTPMG